MIATWTRFTILAFAILGGAYGFAMTVRDLLRVDALGFGTILLHASSLFGFAFVTAAGILFWHDHTERKLLMWAFGIQVPWISLPGFVYKFASGASGMLALVASHAGYKYSGGITAKAELGSTFEIRVLQNAPVEIGVNIVALALLILLWRSVQQPVASDCPSGES